MSQDRGCRMPRTTLAELAANRREAEAKRQPFPEQPRRVRSSAEEAADDGQRQPGKQGITGSAFRKGGDARSARATAKGVSASSLDETNRVTAPASLKSGGRGRSTKKSLGRDAAGAVSAGVTDPSRGDSRASDASPARHSGLARKGGDAHRSKRTLTPGDKTGGGLPSSPVLPPRTSPASLKSGGRGRSTDSEKARIPDADRGERARDAGVPDRSQPSRMVAL